MTSFPPGASASSDADSGLDGDSGESHDLRLSWFQLSSRHAWRRMLMRAWFYKARLADPQWYLHPFKGDEGTANMYLVVWFALNIGITLLSKAMFSRFNFPYPMLLTAIHLGTTGIGSQIASYTGLYPSRSFTPEQLRSLISFSIVFTINIWLSNYALLVVSVPVHQVFRTTIPLFTMGLSLLLYREVYPIRMLPSIIVVIVGVSATVWGDLDMSFWGGLVVAAGCAFSSLKGLMSQKAQIGAKGLHTFDLLRATCPMAVIQLVICASFNGELAGLLSDETISSNSFWVLFSQGLLAFSLNFVSFKCAALKNPLTMNIAGNVKQVITPLFAIWLLGGQLTGALLFGLVATFVGAMWYGKEASIRKEKMKHETEAERTPLTSSKASSNFAMESVQMVADAKRISPTDFGSPGTEEQPVAVLGASHIISVRPPPIAESSTAQNLTDPSLSDGLSVTKLPSIDSHRSTEVI